MSTIKARVESAIYDSNRSTTVDTDMAQMDDHHRQHVANRLRECFEELWGHSVIVRFDKPSNGTDFCVACGCAIKDAHDSHMTGSGAVHDCCHTKRVA